VLSRQRNRLPSAFATAELLSPLFFSSSARCLLISGIFAGCPRGIYSFFFGRSSFDVEAVRRRIAEARHGGEGAPYTVTALVRAFRIAQREGDPAGRLRARNAAGRSLVDLCRFVKLFTTVRPVL